MTDEHKLVSPKKVERVKNITSTELSDYIRASWSHKRRDAKKDRKGNFKRYKLSKETYEYMQPRIQRTPSKINT